MQEDYGMTRVFAKRLCKYLMFLAMMALALVGSSPQANTFSARLSPLWDAPRGPGHSDDASRWLEGLREAVAQPDVGCEQLLLPELSSSRPARAFRIEVERELFAAESLIVYLQEPIAEYFIVVATDVDRKSVG